MTRIAYIASGDGHCGSTLLDMLLSGHSRICGLGEVNVLLEPDQRSKYVDKVHDDRICSCGLDIAACPVWSRLLGRLEEAPTAPWSSHYSHLLEIIDHVCGTGTLVSDSSKYIGALQSLVQSIRAGEIRDLEVDDILVIHLFKDVRSSVTSRRRRERVPAWHVPRLARMFYGWCRSNRRLHDYLRNEGLRHISVTYESLCMSPERTLTRICTAMGVQFERRMLDLANSSGHVGLGNPMRTHETKSKAIIYDSRWFHQPDVQLLYFALPGVRSINEALVNAEAPQDRSSRLFEPSKP